MKTMALTLRNRYHGTSVRVRVLAEDLGEAVLEWSAIVTNAETRVHERTYRQDVARVRVTRKKLCGAPAGCPCKCKIDGTSWEKPARSRPVERIWWNKARWRRPMKAVRCRRCNVLDRDLIRIESDSCGCEVWYCVLCGFPLRRMQCRDCYAEDHAEYGQGGRIMNDD